MLNVYLLTKVSVPWDHWNLSIFGIRSCATTKLRLVFGGQCSRCQGWLNEITCVIVYPKSMKSPTRSSTTLPSRVLGLACFWFGIEMSWWCHGHVNPFKTCQVNWRSLRFLVNGHVLAQRTTVSSSLSRRGVMLRDKMVGWVISSHLS